MTEQAHQTKRAAAQSSLTRLCQFLKNNGHPIKGSLEEEINTIHEALIEYHNVTKALSDIQSQTQSFFNEK